MQKLNLVQNGGDEPFCTNTLKTICANAITRVINRLLLLCRCGAIFDTSVCKQYQNARTNGSDSVVHTLLLRIIYCICQAKFQLAFTAQRSSKSRSQQAFAVIKLALRCAMKWRHNTDSNNGLHTTYYILGRLLPNTFLHTFQHATWQREKASNHTFAQLSKVELVERLTVAVLVLPRP